MKKIDALLKKVELFEKLAVHGDRKSLLASIAQATPMVGGTPEAEKYLADLNPPGPQTLKETTIVGNPPIDTKIQDMLNELLAVQRSDIFPLRLDGELGPETRKALKKFTEVFGKPASQSAIAQVYKEKSSGQQMVNLDDAAKSREEYYKSQSIPPGMPGSRT